MDLPHTRVWVTIKGMKRNYTITLDSEVWQRLEDMAQEQGLRYQGRPSRSAVIEDLVRGTPAVEQPVVRALVLPPIVAPHPALTLADVVALWPAKMQAQWEQEKWKAERWVRLVLDAINAQ